MDSYISGLIATNVSQLRSNLTAGSTTHNAVIKFCTCGDHRKLVFRWWNRICRLLRIIVGLIRLPTTCLRLPTTARLPTQPSTSAPMQNTGNRRVPVGLLRSRIDSIEVLPIIDAPSGSQRKTQRSYRLLQFCNPLHLLLSGDMDINWTPLRPCWVVSSFYRTLPITGSNNANFDAMMDLCTYGHQRIMPFRRPGDHLRLF